MPSILRPAIAAAQPGFDLSALGPDSWERLERLARASPLYARTLCARPSLCLWLENDHNLRTTYRPRALLDEWRAFKGPAEAEDGADPLGLMRQWRRVMSLRIAHRSVNALADEPTTVAELSRLADFCLKECLRMAESLWTGRLGMPWDKYAGRRARFCALALGKLGGEELNFSSDIDLIFCFEGEGHCRRDSVPASVTNSEFFTKVADTAVGHLNARTADGFLFRVDVRLRPEGAWGPLVHSLSAIENYYATAGQTWERLALLKARPAAGDIALGAELLEDLHSFRYPRRPPPSLLAEVAAMKLRTEQEIVGAAALDRDIKRGPGGIREIEFVAQSLQLLHAGRYPFLQTNATATALERLARYQLLSRADAAFLSEAYWLLRKVEHRLQMRDEEQTHELPADPAERSALAASLGFAGPEAFDETLEAVRKRVHAFYAGLFADRDVDREFEVWWEFFTTEKLPAAAPGAPWASAAARVERWFGPGPEPIEAVRLFVCGDHRLQITRELVTRFQHLASNFDALVPELGRPLPTLARLARCAERYGTRQQFLNACADNPQLLRVLALLCDRSDYSVELICARPEILEEVLRPEMLRRRKLPRDIAGELSAGPAPDGPEGADWLWLYVRAEQLRYSIGELLGYLTPQGVEAALTQLAEAVIARTLKRSRTLIVALGKFGGGELAFGSDLDLLAVAEEGGPAPGGDGPSIETLRRILLHGGPLGPIFPLDLRLRPHGNAGPVATTLQALSQYHASPAAQTWEKQLLVRARVVSGPPALAKRFHAWLERLLYSAPPTAAEEEAMWAMRVRIERERDRVMPPERAFKSGAGGLIDIEFLVQSLQLRHGPNQPKVRQTGTRQALHALGEAGCIDSDDEARLMGNFEFLRKIEFNLRRDSNQAVAVLPDSPAGREPLARWLGFRDEAAFWAEHLRRLKETRGLVRKLGGSAAESALAP